MRRGRRVSMLLLTVLAVGFLALGALAFFPETQTGVTSGGILVPTASPTPTATPKPTTIPEPVDADREVAAATPTSPVNAPEVTAAPAPAETAPEVTAAPAPTETAPEVTVAPTPPTETEVLDVPFIDQRRRWPTGCESVSTVMALQYWGADVEVDEFIEDYLPRGNAPYWKDNVLWACDPWKAFPGDPHSKNGWGCFPPVIVAALEGYLDQCPELSLTVTSLAGASLDDLCATYIDQGIPVILWATIGMEAPRPGLTFCLEDTGEEYTWTDPLHCLLPVGWDETSYYFNDPLAAKGTAYSREATQRAYEGLGSLAVVVAPKERPGETPG